MSRKREKRKKPRVSSGSRKSTSKNILSKRFPFAVGSHLDSRADSRFIHDTFQHVPPDANHYINLGNMFLDQGRLDEAILCYQKALQLKPDSVEVYYNMGNAFLDQGKPDEAIACYEKALQLRPNLPEPYNNMGIAYQEKGMWDEAIASYQKAVEIKPDFSEAWNNMGITLDDQGSLDEAVSCFEKALKLRPGFADAHNNLANTFRNIGKFDEAISSYDKALQLKPDPGFEVRRALALPVINSSTELLERCRSSLVESLTLLRKEGLRLEDPNEQVSCVTTSLAYHGMNDRKIQEEIASFYANACPDLQWVAPDRKKLKRKDDRIKIGIVSKFLYNHTIGRLNLGIIRKLTREKFHVTVFQFPAREDHLAKAISRAADEVVVLPTSLAVARQEIAGHSLDILFYPDIGMEPFTYFLAFSRLAPVQCVTWGHPVTTGIPNMDYFISSENAEPSGAEDHYSERLIRLRRLGTYYYRPEVPQRLATRDKFNLPDDCNLYVCPQTLFKLHPDFDDILGAILHRDRRGLLILIEGDHNHWMKLLRDRFARSFPDALDRVRFLPKMSRKDFLALLTAADVLLDTAHFSGGNTSLESFAFGVPIVTLPGEFLRGRLTLALYEQMGVMDCVADDAESYVNIALRLANDRSWSEEIRGKIRARADVLYEDIEAVRELERFFEWAAQG